MYGTEEFRPAGLRLLLTTDFLGRYGVGAPLARRGGQVMELAKPSVPKGSGYGIEGPSCRRFRGEQRRAAECPALPGIL